MSRYEFPMTPGYVQHWNVVDGVREICQNSLDAVDNDLSGEVESTVDYSAESQVLYITTTCAELPLASMLLGYTTKSTNDSQRGQFGEGYKLAMLVLSREGKKVVVLNAARNEVWRPKIITSRRFDHEIMVIDITKEKDLPGGDLVFTVEGVTPSEWESIRASNLHVNDIPQAAVIEYGESRILLGHEYRESLFVGGLLVREFATANRYGYDLAPGVVTVDRDRRMVSDWDFYWETSKLWNNVDEDHYDKVLDMIFDDAPETQYIANIINPCSGLLEAAVSRFTEEHGEEAYPVDSDSEAEIIIGLFPDTKTVCIRSLLARLLRKHPSIEDRRGEACRANSPFEVLQEWYGKQDFEDLEFVDILDTSKGWYS